MDEISWHSLLGNKYSRCPNSEMAGPNGEIVVRSCNIQGGSKYSYDAKTRMVKYGRDYVVAWLAKRFFSNFTDMKWNELQHILSEAYKKAREEHRG